MLARDILESFADSQILVTGGSGLIGRQVVDLLCSVDANVHVASLDNLILNKQASYICVDLCSFENCKKLTADMDYVFHIAGIKGSVEVTRAKPVSFFVPMLMMNTNMLEASRLNGVKKLVYTSSVGAYSSAEIFKEDENCNEPPMDEFPGWAKRMAEKQVEAYKIQYDMENFAIVRAANVYGPGDNFDPNNAMVIPSLMYRIYHQPQMVRVWGDGSAIRDFAYSKDVAEGIISALYYGTGGGFVNLGSGIGFSIRELVIALREFIEFNYEFDTSKSSGFPRRIMDISLARQLINYNPSTSLADGLRATWSWFMQHQEDHLLKKNYFVD